MRSRLFHFALRHRRLAQRCLAVLVPRPVLIDVQGFKMYARLDDWVIGLWIALRRVYVRYVTTLMQAYLKPGVVMIDIGANIGYFTLLAASRIGPTGKVIAFEPAPDNCALLQMSLQANGFQNVAVHARAVADTNGPMGFIMLDSNGRILRNGALEGSTQVEAVSLDTFLADEPRIDLIKIDIEGAEALALCGMRQLLQRHRPVVFTEFMPQGLERVSGVAPETYLSDLRALGYELRVIYRSGPSPQPQSDAEIMAAYAASGGDHLDLLALPVGD